MKFNIVFLALAFVAATFASPAPESEQAENVAPQSLVFRRKQEAQQNVAPQSLVFRRKEQSQKNVAPQSLVFRRDDESNSEKRDDAESAEGLSADWSYNRNVFKA